ncbi:MAG: hypothetical protein LIR50_02585, partial [Bacillota bacterium]|nr:hypothetical protein [Bacillota bacterium]
KIKDGDNVIFKFAILPHISTNYKVSHVVNTDIEIYEPLLNKYVKECDNNSDYYLPNGSVYMTTITDSTE